MISEDCKYLSPNMVFTCVLQLLIYHGSLYLAKTYKCNQIEAKKNYITLFLHEMNEYKGGSYTRREMEKQT